MRSFLILCLMALAAVASSAYNEDRDPMADLYNQLYSMGCQGLSSVQPALCMFPGPQCDAVNSVMNIESCPGNTGKATSLDAAVTAIKSLGCTGVNLLKSAACVFPNPACAFLGIVAINQKC